ncbi:MAG: PAS domain-containing sensor histidine kinase, partial [Planctomycetota bacterium]
VEYRIITSDGNTRWLSGKGQGIRDEIGNVLFLDGALFDITDHKEAEQALLESEIMNRSLLEGSPVCNKVIDMDFKLQYMSSAGQRHLKIPDIKPYYGQTYPPEFYPESMRAPLIKHLKVAMAGDISSVEAPVHDMQGNEVWYHTTFVPALDENGRVKFVIGSSVNITDRKKAEQSLQESEERFRDFFEGAPIGFHIFGPDQIITDINDAELEMIGYSRDQIVGKKTWADLIVPGQREMFQKHWENIISKRDVRNLEYTLVCKEGKHIDVILNASARFDDDGNIVNTRGSVLNITARKRAELTLQKSEGRYRTLVENINLGITLIDVDHNIVMANSTIGKFFHCDLSELIGKKCHETFEKRPEVCFHCPGEKAIKSGQPEEVETEGVRDDGSRFTARLQAFPLFGDDLKPTGFIEVVEDITQRKQVETAFKKSRERLALALSAANDGLWDWNIETGQVYFSPRYYTMLGYKPNEFPASFEAWGDLLDPDERQTTEAKIREHIEAKSEGFEEEFRLRTKDGHWRWVLSKGKVVRRGPNDEPIRMVGTHSDITERKLAEQARQRLNKELEVKNKELESILYAASHDLKSPLVNIQGFGYELAQSCELIRSALMDKKSASDVGKAVDATVNKDIPEALDVIMASTTKMDLLLSGLLDLCRLNTAVTNVKHIDVNAMMYDIIASMKYQIKESAVKIDIETLPACVCDPSQISRVFSNLLTNALKFLDESRPGKICISGKSQNNKSIYCVEDNGIGIAGEHQEKIFQMFYQHQPDKRDGEGIGLTIVRRIIEKHNGDVWVESQPGKGSKFFVSLPNA